MGPLELSGKSIDAFISAAIKGGLTKGLWGAVLFFAGIAGRLYFKEFTDLQSWEGTFYRVGSAVSVALGVIIFFAAAIMDLWRAGSESGKPEASEPARVKKSRSP